MTSNDETKNVNVADSPMDQSASDTIIDIETFARTNTPTTSLPQETVDLPPEEMLSPQLEDSSLSSIETSLQEEPTEYQDIHIKDSKVRPFFAVDMDELHLAFRKRGIYHEQEKDPAATALSAPTPVRLVRPLSKATTQTTATGGGGIGGEMLTPTSSPPETPLSSFPSATQKENEDKISVIKENLADTKHTMLENLKSLVDRGSELESLQQQSGMNG